MKHLVAVLAFSLLPLAGSAAILPDTIGSYHLTGPSKPPLADQPIWDDYGLKHSEKANYENGARKFAVTAWQLQDTTGALAAFDWQRPADAKPSKLAPLAAETADSLLWVHGQYLLFFEGYKPSSEELDALAQGLKNVDTTALPVLPSYLPAENLVANSERYVTGPASLARFDPAISAALAGFHYGAEAQTGVFHSPKGDMTLAIFDYPTPQIAMDKVTDFQKLPGAMAKRAGPLVAVLVSPADPEFAERLLGQIRYEAQVTRDEYVPTQRDNMGNLLLNICILIGILAAFALLSGVLFGGLRYLVRLARHGEEPEPMITLHLE
jgi:Family of unknown function (DUF6599)